MKQFIGTKAAKVVLAVVACLGLIASLVAQPLLAPKPETAQYVAGEHYQVLSNPVKLAAEDKIEVMEVFWYGCSHCFSFESLVNVWQTTIADDVEFARTPAVWRKQMKSHARLYYVAETLGLPHEIHTDIFSLLTTNPTLDERKKFAQVFAKYNVSEEDFYGVFDSFGVKGKVAKAETRVRKNYRVQGTPEMVVNGKYRVSARDVGGQAQMLQVVDFLVEKERNLNK